MSDTDDDLKELEKEEKELARRRKKLEEQEEKEKKGKNFRFVLTMIFLILLLVLILVLVLLHSCGKEEEPELSEQIESTLNDLIDGKEGEVELITESVLQSAVKNATLYTAV